jgi:hypothetical protein
VSVGYGPQPCERNRSEPQDCQTAGIAERRCRWTVQAAYRLSLLWKRTRIENAITGPRRKLLTRIPAFVRKRLVKKDFGSNRADEIEELLRAANAECLSDRIGNYPER